MTYRIYASLFVLATALALVGAGCVSVSPRTEVPSEPTVATPNPSPAVVAASSCTKAGAVTFAAANDASTDWNIYLNGKNVDTAAREGEASVTTWLEVPGTTYLALDPSGLGGYIPYAGHETLIAIDHCTGAVSSFTAPTGGLMAISNDGSKLITAALYEGGLGSETHVYVWNTDEALNSHDPVGPTADWIIPDDWAFQGSFVFNADDSMVAFAAGDGPDDEHGAVYALNLSTGIFNIVKESPTGLLYVDGFNADGTVKTH